MPYDLVKLCSGCAWYSGMYHSRTPIWHGYHRCPNAILTPRGRFTACKLTIDAIAKAKGIAIVVVAKSRPLKETNPLLFFCQRYAKSLDYKLKKKSLESSLFEKDSGFQT